MQILLRILKSLLYRLVILLLLLITKYFQINCDHCTLYEFDTPTNGFDLTDTAVWFWSIETSVWYSNQWFVSDWDRSMILQPMVLIWLIPLYDTPTNNFIWLRPLYDTPTNGFDMTDTAVWYSNQWIWSDWDRCMILQPVILIWLRPLYDNPTNGYGSD